MAEQRRLVELQRCGTQYAQLRTRLGEVGFICEGSLVERWMRCGKSNCACARDRAQRHGPYFQLSWKEKGKTISRRLLPEHATLYRQWVANRQRLQSIIQQMKVVSRKACRHLLQAEQSNRTPPKPRDIAASPR
jgi:hypothetical protein